MMQGYSPMHNWSLEKRNPSSHPTGLALMNQVTMSLSKPKKKPSYYFPEEILSEVFKRLPVKYVLRCSAVQKSWYHIIKSPLFISQHCNHQKMTAHVNRKAISSSCDSKIQIWITNWSKVLTNSSSVIQILIQITFFILYYINFILNYIIINLIFNLY